MRNMKKINKYGFFCIGIFIIMFSITLLNSNLLSEFYANNNDLSEEVSPFNHNYPVYNSLILQLNNETHGNLIARVKTLNQTTGEWEFNHALLDQISKDMRKISESINYLHEIYFYEYNDSLEPGILYFLLCTPIEHAKAVSEEVIEQILSDPITWWYVANVSFPVIDLGYFDGWHYGNFDYISPNFFGFSTGKSTISNNSTVIHFYERDGIISTPLLYHNETSTTLKLNGSIEASEFSINNPFIELFKQDLMNLHKHFWYLYDATFEYIISALWDFEQNNTIHSWQLIDIKISIHYNTSLSYNNQFRLFFMIFTIYSHFWYADPGVMIKTGLSDSPPVVQYILIILGFVAIVGTIVGSVVFFVIRYKIRNKR